MFAVLDRAEALHRANRYNHTGETGSVKPVVISIWKSRHFTQYFYVALWFFGAFGGARVGTSGRTGDNRGGAAVDTESEQTRKMQDFMHFAEDRGLVEMCLDDSGGFAYYITGGGEPEAVVVAQGRTSRARRRHHLRAGGILTAVLLLGTALGTVVATALSGRDDRLIAAAAGLLAEVYTAGPM